MGALVGALAACGSTTAAAQGTPPVGALDPSYGSAGQADTGLKTLLVGPTALFAAADGKVVVAAADMGHGSPLRRLIGSGAVLRRLTDRGRRDTTFRGVIHAGIRPLAAAAVPGDGGYVLGGPTTASSSLTPSVGLLRTGPDGAATAGFGRAGLLRPAFGPTGKAHVADRFGAIAVQPDGKLVVAGAVEAAGNGCRLVVARYDAGGTLDPSFGTGGRTAIVPRRIVAARLPGRVLGEGLCSSRERTVTGVLVQGDGGILVAATGLDDRTKRLVGVLVRCDAAGHLDRSFGTEGTVRIALGARRDTRVAAIAPQTVDGEQRIVVLTETATRLRRIAPALYAGSPRMGLLRLDGRGRIDRGFGTAGRVAATFGGPVHAVGVAVAADGRITAVGDMTFQAAVVRTLADGAPDPAFGGGRTCIGGNVFARRGRLLRPSALALGAGGAAYVGSAAVGGAELAGGRIVVSRIRPRFAETAAIRCTTAAPVGSSPTGRLVPPALVGFQLARPGRVALQIASLLPSRSPQRRLSVRVHVLETVHLGRRTAGTHHYRWNGRIRDHRIKRASQGSDRMIGFRLVLRDRSGKIVARKLVAGVTE